MTPEALDDRIHRLIEERDMKKMKYLKKEMYQDRLFRKLK